MRLYWARFKDYSKMPPRYNCCENTRKKLRSLAGMKLLVDLDDSDSMSGSYCSTCGHAEKGDILGVLVVHCAEVDQVNWRVDQEMLEVEEKPAEVIWPNQPPAQA